MITPQAFVKAYEKHGSIKAVSRNEGITYGQARKAYQIAVLNKLMDAQPVGRKSNDQVKTPEPVFTGDTHIKKVREFKVPEGKDIKRYLFTSAQNNTKIHEGLWANLKALAKHYDAEIHVSRYTYMKSGLGLRGDKALFTPVKDETLYGAKTVAWCPEIEDYHSDERCQVAPGLVWCGEWQRLPTVKRPLSGYESYTGRKSGIFPHAKIEMSSVPASKFEDPKFNYTTGTVTRMNYIVKGAGLQAIFHHGFGALLVEVDSDGDWFCRQVNSTNDGVICDLDVMVKDGKVTTGHQIEGLNQGDTHHQEMDPTANLVVEKIIDDLKPKNIFYNDLLNFGSANHHEMKDPFRKFERYSRGQNDVREEVRGTMHYMVRRSFLYPDSHHVVVDSNHDRAAERWLREADWRHDPTNMLFYMEAAQAKLQAIAAFDPTFHLMRHWWELHTMDMSSPTDNVTFLDEDESLVICEDAHGGNECGMHGHLGPNGAQGSAAAFAKMGRKANVGHTHSCGIYDGIYTAGTTSIMDLGYNRGPSSWSHSEIVTYQTGKRAIITLYNGKYKAGISKVRAAVKKIKKDKGLSSLAAIVNEMKENGAQKWPGATISRTIPDRQKKGKKA